MNASPETMHALRIHERGGAELLVYEKAPRPFVGIGDVLLRVGGASLTPTELGWPSTWVDHAGRDRRPVIPAHEVSGVVEALGYGTTGFAIGDAVYGLTDWYRDGAAAEYVAVAAAGLAPKPKSLGHVEAASVPLAGLTAWQALFDHGHLAAGQTVLVHGAGGGVGIFAVQLARATGARVVAAARGWSRDLVTGLGAEQFVDVETQQFEEALRAPVDLVFDLVGGIVLERSWSVIKPGGALVSVVEMPSAAKAKEHRVRGAFFVVDAHRQQLIELGQRLDAGELKTIVGATFPLERGRDAFQAKQAPGVAGKIVLETPS